MQSANLGGRWWKSGNSPVVLRCAAQVNWHLQLYACLSSLPLSHDLLASAKQTQKSGVWLLKCETAERLFRGHSSSRSGSALPMITSCSVSTGGGQRKTHDQEPNNLELDSSFFPKSDPVIIYGKKQIHSYKYDVHKKNSSRIYFKYYKNSSIKFKMDSFFFISSPFPL